MAIQLFITLLITIFARMSAIQESYTSLYAWEEGIIR